MDITSVFSGMMIGAGLGLAFCVAILYRHNREVIMKKASSVGNDSFVSFDSLPESVRNPECQAPARFDHKENRKQ
jgi:hypothetical protein